MLMRSAFPLWLRRNRDKAARRFKRQTGLRLLHRQYAGVEQRSRDADRV